MVTSYRQGQNAKLVTGAISASQHSAYARRPFCAVESSCTCRVQVRFPVVLRLERLGSMERVLVVDDDASVVEVCTSLLRDAGYAAEGVSQAGRALDLVREGSFDLVLADIVMPEIDGFTLIDHVHEIDPALGIVMITAYGTLEMSIQALSRGAQGFIVKPFDESQLETVVGNALARRRLARETFRLEALIPLFEISRQFMQSTDLESLLGSIVRVSQSGTGASGVALMLQEDPAGQYGIAAATGMVTEGEDVVGILGPLVPDIVNAGEATLVESGEGLQGSYGQTMEALGASSLLALPLRSGGLLKGALVLVKKQGERPFSAADSEFLTVLGGQAAAALANAGLLDETRRRLSESEALLDLSRGMTESLQTDRLLQLVVDSVIRLIPLANKCVIHLIGDEGARLLPRYSSDPDPAQLADSGIPVGQGIAGCALRTRETILVPDVRSDPRFLRLGSRDGLLSLLVSPLFVGDRDIGTLSVNSVATSAFGPDEVRLLTTLGRQAAVALEQARLVESLIAEKRRVEAIIQSMADGLIMFDRTGRVTAMNPALEQMTGVPAERVIGRIITGLEDEESMRRVSSICSIETPVEDVSIGQRVLQVHSSTVLDDSGAILGYVRVVHDVTGLHEADRMKSEFISNVSHELRTPLFSIRGFLELMKTGKVSDEEIRAEFVDTMYRKTLHLNRLVDDLLDVARIEQGTFELELGPLAIRPLILHAVSEMQFAADESGVRLDTSLPDNLSPVWGDPNRLEQVVVNLLDNAVKFTGRGGSVTVRAEEVERELVVEVEDTGRGIPTEAMDKLFTRFYQIDASSTRRSGGAGLGLSISQQIVEAHGGRIWAESQEGKGSTFCFTVPLAEGREA